MTPKYLSFLAANFLLIILNAAVFGQFRFDRWSTDNGLQQNGVRGIARTLDGYLWVTTFDGLARFELVGDGPARRAGRGAQPAL